MSLAALESLLTRPIAYHPVVAEACGSITAGVMLCQAIYWSERTNESRDGWFYKTCAEWTKETALSRHEQDGARRILKAKGFIEEHLTGVPPKVHFRVNVEAVCMGVSQFAEKRQIELTESGKLNCQKVANCVAEKRQIDLPKSGKTYKEAETTIDNAENKNTYPSWLPIDVFNDYVENRKKKKKALTDIATRRLISKIDRLRSLGHDPAELIENAIIKGWMSVYPPSAGIKDPNRSQSDTPTDHTKGLEHRTEPQWAL